MRKFKTDILIRNNRLNMMQDNGLVVDYKILSNDDYITELKKKLLEESQEVIDSKNLDEIKSEVADVLEVIEHILNAYNINSNEIDLIKTNKQNKIGGFDKKIKTISISMPDEHEEAEYYLSKPHKYPEIKS